MCLQRHFGVLPSTLHTLTSHLLPSKMRLVAHGVPAWRRAAPAPSLSPTVDPTKELFHCDSERIGTTRTTQGTQQGDIRLSTRTTSTFESGSAPSWAAMGRLVVVSNRVPAPGPSEGRDRNTPVGGLVVAVAPGLKLHGGLWFGWSGRSTQRRPDAAPALSRIGEINLASIDLSEDDVSLFYTGFANRTMWPLLHSFTDRTVIQHSTYWAYERINRRFAEALYPMLEAGDMVWVHDYHLLHMGHELRQLGWHGKIGFFLHVPFPPADIFATLPWSRQLLTVLLGYDLVCVHTDRYLRNLADSFADQLRDLTSGTVFAPDGTSTFTHDGMSTRLGVYPAGIYPAVFQDPAGEDARGLAEQLSIADSPDHRIILAVAPPGLYQRDPSAAQGLRTAVGEKSFAARKRHFRTDLLAFPLASARVDPREGSGRSACRTDQRSLFRGRLGTCALPLPALHSTRTFPLLPRCRRLRCYSPTRRHEPRREGVRRLPEGEPRDPGPLKVLRRRSHLDRCAPGQSLRCLRHRRGHLQGTADVRV